MSLSIGTELALLDQILINKKISKDSLTGALKAVFENQYELSLATSNPFVLAMCDLDYFKIINDKYGHIAGDRLRKSFSQIELAYEGSLIKATVSIGMVEIRPTESFKHSFLDEYIMIADQNLYMVKAAGRNSVHSH